MLKSRREAIDANAAVPKGTDGAQELEVSQAEHRRNLAEQQKRLRAEAQETFGAMVGWQNFESEGDWEAKLAQADADLRSGKFLIDRLGGLRHLHPDLIAAMLVLRSQTIEDYDAKTAAEIMVIDCMMISYYHQLRINGWINNLSTRLEHEFFGRESLTATFKGEYGAEADKIRGLTVEELVRQLGDKLQTQFTGANRTFLRNLKALQELRERPRPSVHIERVGQMNVADTQANAVMGGAEFERPEITAPPRPRSNRRAAADHGAQPREEQARAPRRRSARPRATRELQAAPSPARRNGKPGHDERKP